MLVDIGVNGKFQRDSVSLCSRTKSWADTCGWQQAKQGNLLRKGVLQEEAVWSRAKSGSSPACYTKDGLLGQFLSFELIHIAKVFSHSLLCDILHTTPSIPCFVASKPTWMCFITVRSYRSPPDTSECLCSYVNGQPQLELLSSLPLCQWGKAGK